MFMSYVSWDVVRLRASLLCLIPASGLFVLANGCGSKPDTGTQAPQAVVEDYDASLRAAQENADDQKASKKKAP